VPFHQFLASLVEGGFDEGELPSLEPGEPVNFEVLEGKRYRLKQVIDTYKDVFLSVFDIYAETEMSPWLHEITQPCLVLTGENDGGCNPRLNRQIAAALPNSELVILSVLRHAILLEAADQVVPPVLAFLRKQRAG